MGKLNKEQTVSLLFMWPMCRVRASVLLRADDVDSPRFSSGAGWEIDFIFRLCAPIVPRLHVNVLAEAALLVEFTESLPKDQEL